MLHENCPPLFRAELGIQDSRAKLPAVALGSWHHASARFSFESGQRLAGYKVSPHSKLGPGLGESCLRLSKGAQCRESILHFGAGLHVSRSAYARNVLRTCSAAALLTDSDASQKQSYLPVAPPDASHSWPEKPKLVVSGNAATSSFITESQASSHSCTSDMQSQAMG